MAGTIPTEDSSPVTPLLPRAPIFRVSRTFCINNIRSKFRNLKDKTSDGFFCVRDPDQATFYLSMCFGTTEPDYFSVYLHSVSRDISVKDPTISLFDASGHITGKKTFADCVIRKGKNVGIPKMQKYDGPAATQSKTWKMLVEFEYIGVRPVALPLIAQPKSQIQSELLHLLRTGDQADVTFHVQGEKIMGHKLLLTTRCEYFRSMFDSGMAESASKEIEVPDIAPNVFQSLLDFVYSDVPPNYDGESTMALLSAADKYDMDNLKKMCETAICSNLNGENVIEALLLAEKHHCDTLMVRAIEVFGCYVSVLKTEEKWSKLMESPSLILKLLEYSHN